MQLPTKLVSSAHPTLNFGHPTLESFIWNTIIRAHVQGKATPISSLTSPLSIYIRMRFHGVQPDFHTFPFLLKAFVSPSHLQSGQNIHSQILHFGLTSDPFIQTSLINMYSSCANLGSAQQLFDEIPHPDLPSCNSIIHANVRVGRLDIARRLFDQMAERNVISWSCILDGYARCGKYKEVLDLFREMQALGDDVVRPNEFTMSVVLSACGRLGALEHGKWAHAYLEKLDLRIDVILGTSLIDMYARCGSVDRVRLVFDSLGLNKDVMAWSAMISGLAMNGHFGEALGLFSNMINHGVRPNGVTFVGVLSACVHCGLINEGIMYFEKMSKEFGISPAIQHYGCMVDLYGRAGRIDKAWEVVKSMPMEPDVLVWGALLSGSRTYGDIETCEAALQKLVELEPENCGAYVLLSNAYAKLGKWQDVRRVRDLMDTKGIKKLPGCSSVEVDGVIHEFFVGDETHSDNREIYMMLEEILSRLKKEGYVENTEEALLDLDQEGKAISLSLHSEKLAVAFAILKTSAGTSIRIMKNLRICRDCHVFMKMTSRVLGREIVVRDCNRFHHFVEGMCSCNDYW